MGLIDLNVLEVLHLSFSCLTMSNVIKIKWCIFWWSFVVVGYLKQNKQLLSTLISRENLQRNVLSFFFLIFSFESHFTASGCPLFSLELKYLFGNIIHEHIALKYPTDLALLCIFLCSILAPGWVLETLQAFVFHHSCHETYLMLLSITVGAILLMVVWQLWVTSLLITWMHGSHGLVKFLWSNRCNKHCDANIDNSNFRWSHTHALQWITFSFFLTFSE